jgi:hypothetical protein
VSNRSGSKKRISLTRSDSDDKEKTKKSVDAMIKELNSDNVTIESNPNPFNAMHYNKPQTIASHAQFNIIPRINKTSIDTAQLDASFISMNSGSDYRTVQKSTQRSQDRKHFNRPVINAESPFGKGLAKLRPVLENRSQKAIEPKRKESI